MHLPSIRQLQYLVALQDVKHFGKAAALQNVTQSTLSTGIKELESFLGVTLVERNNKSLAFTEIGCQIVDRSRDIIMQAEDLVSTARGQSNPLSTPIKLGVIPTIAPYLISQYIISIRQQFEAIKLYIREDTTANLINELLQNKLDLALLALPYEVSQISTHISYRERLHLAYHKASKFINPDKMDFNTLPDESLLLLDDGHCLRDHALAGCRLKNHKKIHTFGSNSLQMLLQMVDDDLGITLLPDMAVDAGILKNTNIKIKQLPENRYYRDIGFAWRSNASRQTMYLELIALLPH